MTAEETLRLMAIVTACTGQEFDDPDLDAWFAILSPLDFERCQAAVVMLARQEPDRRALRPGHVWQLARTTTDGDRERRAVDAGHRHQLESGVVVTVRECSSCWSLHGETEPCTALTTHGGGTLRALAGVFRRPPALTSGEAAAHGGDRPVTTGAAAEPTAQERAAEEAARRRQLEALDAVMAEG